MLFEGKHIFNFVRFSMIWFSKASPKPPKASPNLPMSSPSLPKPAESFETERCLSFATKRLCIGESPAIFFLPIWPKLVIAEIRSKF